MNQLKKIDTNPLDNIIIGRVDPKIYAFTTETIPNYLKVGDTYRPIETRLNEWRNYFPNLKKRFGDVARVDEETFFRDYSVHYFLEHEKGKARLKEGDIKDIPRYSNEFFKGATEKDVENAIKDIKKSHKDNQDKYQYYKFEESRIPITHIYEQVEDYDPRPNQKKTIEKFKKAVDSGVNNLLMYAVMRFGKSFTSMCCAVEIKARIILVVSAKADVQEEWKKTVESHKKFSDYIFLNSKQLLDSETIVKDRQESGKKIVIFLTLQDLQGQEIKKKHKEIFQNKIDLLIIDETHFGARAEEYGRVLQGVGGINKKDIKQELKLNDESLDELEKEVKILDTRIRLHLSGTPYRILMGSEFKDEDIIAFYQFSDIAEDQKKWDEKNLYKDEVKEWDNPYYGFPQMVRFAFHPNESSRKKMEELKSHGISYTLSELLKPQSITKDTKNNLHKKFKHEVETFDLFKVIDGSKKDENILNFLDYEKIQKGKMCRHIVCVLPYRASCDALEALLKRKKLKNLGEYKVINISGVDGGKKYKTIQLVQSKIKEYESKNQKTITLTVNRMLTGSTVPEWDTMLYFKDTASPQEYDQAVFRLQNQYVRTYREPNSDTVKFNMKPQTLLVDFSPNRIFEMQEQKALIYNANTDKRGGTELKKQIQRELDISPIIVINNNRIKEITPTDILDAVRNYSKDRGVDDEARAIPIDMGLLNFPEIRAEIERQNEIGSKQGLEISVAEGEEDDMDIDDMDNEDLKKDKTDKDFLDIDKEAGEDFRKKFATYYMRMLFFSFLTNSKVESVQDIINVLKNNEDNKRIVENLGINVGVLTLVQEYMNTMGLSILDQKINNINSLANDSTEKLIDRASVAMRKFTRLSESEVVTPEFITDEMINALPEKEIKTSTKILDIASKQGEFVYAIYKKFGKKIANNVYSIPTSKAAYEFTRKIYESLDLNVDNIEEEYTSYQLIEDSEIINGKNVKINDMSIKFDVIVGNPPYQEMNQDTSDAPIYNLFMDTAYKLSDKAVLIHPARFLFNAGKTSKKWNEKMLKDSSFMVIKYYQNSGDVFFGPSIPGGVVITYRDRDKKFGPIEIFTPFNELNGVLNKVIKTKGLKYISDWVFSPESYKLTKKVHIDFPDTKNKLSKGHAYDVTTNIFEKLPEVFLVKKPKNIGKYFQILGRYKNSRVYRYVKREYISDHPNIKKYKVILPKSNGSPSVGDKNTSVIGNPILGKPHIGHNQTFISIGSLDTEIEARNLLKYVKSKFCRAILGTLKVTQDNKKGVWKNVPLQDFTSKSDIDWSKSISKIDEQLYDKYNLTKKERDFIEKNVKPME